MQEEFDLHELAVEDARHGHQRPKIEEYGDTLFAVLHTVEVGPTDDLVQSARSTSSSARTTCSRCATARSRAFSACARAPSASRELLKHGSGFVFYALMDAVVDRYFPILDALETELEVIEGQIFEPRRRARQHRAAVRAEAARDRWLRHAVTPLMEAAGKLIGGRVPQVCATDGEYFRDVLRPPGAHRTPRSTRCARRSAPPSR